MALRFFDSNTPAVRDSNNNQRHGVLNFAPLRELPPPEARTEQGAAEALVGQIPGGKNAGLGVSTCVRGRYRCLALGCGHHRGRSSRVRRSPLHDDLRC